MSTENRKHERRGLTRPVYAKMQIELLDISRSGARLSNHDSIKLPDEFELELSATVSRWSRVIWRNGVQLGVKFIEAPTKRPT